MKSNKANFLVMKDLDRNNKKKEDRQLQNKLRSVQIEEEKRIHNWSRVIISEKGEMVKAWQTIQRSESRGWVRFSCWIPKDFMQCSGIVDVNDRWEWGRLTSVVVVCSQLLLTDRQLAWC